MESAVNFYRSKLGFGVVHSSDCIVHLDNDGPTVILEKASTPNAAQYPNASQVVLAMSIEDLKTTASELRAADVVFIHNKPMEFPGGTFMAFRDPSGNVIELLQFKN
jgi:predicted enzyme related to lactoylglutathione lyase